jgi:hypothetical protein
MLEYHDWDETHNTGFMKELVHCIEMLVPICHTTRCYNAEAHNSQEVSWVVNKYCLQGKENSIPWWKE